MPGITSQLTIAKQVSELIKTEEMYTRRWFEQPGLRVYVRLMPAIQILGYHFKAIDIANIEIPGALNLKDNIPLVLTVLNEIHQENTLEATHLELPPTEIIGPMMGNFWFPYNTAHASSHMLYNLFRLHKRARYCYAPSLVHY